MRIFGFLFIFLTKTIQDNFTPSYDTRKATVFALRRINATSEMSASETPVASLPS